MGSGSVSQRAPALCLQPAPGKLGPAGLGAEAACGGVAGGGLALMASGLLPAL